MTEIELLYQEVDKLEYPDSMLKVRGEIPRRAFFPGGKGTFDNSDQIFDKSIMILGQDFDSDKGFKKSLHQGEEDIQKNTTWRNLLFYLNEAGINPCNCFFTNSIMGIRKGESSTGKSPAFKDKSFIKSCQELFLLQLSLQKPKAILVLGLRVAEFLSATSTHLNVWSKIKNFTSIDNLNQQKIDNVTFKNNVTTSLVLLNHPSCRPWDLDRRTYSGYKGKNAIIHLLISTCNETIL
jgi:hypothetical protein